MTRIDKKTAKRLVKNLIAGDKPTSFDTHNKVVTFKNVFDEKYAVKKVVTSDRRKIVSVGGDYYLVERLDGLYGV